MRILFVCTGNICRSAMAHYYIKEKLRELGIENKYIIESAGTNAYTGDRATEYAIEVMKKYNADLTEHVATNIEDSKINQADLIICMTYAHKRKLITKYPELEEKTFTLKEYVGEKQYIDVDDPWGFGKEVYEACSKEIVYYMDKLIEKLLRGE